MYFCYGVKECTIQSTTLWPYCISQYFCCQHQSIKIRVEISSLSLFSISSIRESSIYTYQQCNIVWLVETNPAVHPLTDRDYAIRRGNNYGPCFGKVVKLCAKPGGLNIDTVKMDYTFADGTCCEYIVEVYHICWILSFCFVRRKYQLLYYSVLIRHIFATSTL